MSLAFIVILHVKFAYYSLSFINLETTKGNEQIMNKVAESYNVSINKDSEDNMKKMKEACQYKIIREYKSLFSCSELIERIIRYHNKNNKDSINKV